MDVYGDPGTPGLVIIPGVMSDAASWRNVALSVDAWQSVSVINRRGRTPSGPLTDRYSVNTEVDDANSVLEELGEPEAIFGWSYGGLIALHRATARPTRRVIAYEPVAPSFGNHALTALREAAEDGDWDRSVELVNREISQFPEDYVRQLRADTETWSALRALSVPLYNELSALSTARVDESLGVMAGRIDLIIGGANVGSHPYGTTFEEIRSHLPARTAVHTLGGLGHLAHIEAPTELGDMLNALR